MTMRDYEPYYTEDGSIGLYSYADKDVYHSKFGALTEAWEKFVLPSNIESLIKQKNDIKVLDICYGIGYNSKALMSFIINKNFSKIKKDSILIKLFNIVSIGINKITLNKIKNLSLYTEKIHGNNSSDIDLKINIDCLDINEELIKLSPLFKTIKTPEEIFSKVIPEIFNCFESYYKLRDIFINIMSNFLPKNRKEINDLLELKFKNMHLDREYRVNELVNYILINFLFAYFGKNYLSTETRNNIRSKKINKFIDNSYLNYAYFNYILGYKTSSNSLLSTFLHNIYYEYLSKRYKNADIKAAQKLFNVNFYIDDARNTLKAINSQYDIIFLDAFTYTKAPQLWSLEFINLLHSKLSDSGVILTYSNSAQIRNTLLENEFYVGKIFNAKANKFIGTIASKDKSKILYPLNNYELGLCATKAGIPYRDPYLNLSNKEILEYREREFKNSNLISSSKYMKIRTLRSRS